MILPTSRIIRVADLKLVIGILEAQRTNVVLYDLVGLLSTGDRIVVQIVLISG